MKVKRLKVEITNMIGNIERLKMAGKVRKIGR
jgi:hypothetical protein